MFIYNCTLRIDKSELYSKFTHQKGLCSLFACRLFWLRLHSLVGWVRLGPPTPKWGGKSSSFPPHRVIAANQGFVQKMAPFNLLEMCHFLTAWVQRAFRLYFKRRVEILQINEIEALVQGGQGPLGRASAASRSLTLSFCPKKIAAKFWILNCGFKIFTLEFWPRNFVGWVPGAGPVQPVVDPELHPASIAASTG